MTREQFIVLGLLFLFNALATLVILHRLGILAGKLSQLTKTGEIEMKNLQALTDEVAANTAIEKSAITLIQGLAAQIEEAKDDPAALDALVASLRANDADLAAAVAANTPAAPAAPTA